MTEEIEKQSEDYTKNRDCYVYDCEDNAIDITGKLRQTFQDGAKWGMEHAIEWHDLKENPEDLPKRENQDCFWSDVIRVKDVCGGYFELQYCFEVKKWYKAYDTAFEFPSKNIVAWCYSPTYKE